MFRQQTNHFGLGESKKTIWFCQEKVKQSAGNLIVVLIRSFGGNPAGGYAVKYLYMPDAIYFSGIKTYRFPAFKPHTFLI